jgi:PTH1 family peptidyl-tRNA hydrolase
MGYLRLVAGLGNPGREHALTRHNVGFMVLDRLAARRGLAFSLEKKWQCAIARWDDMVLAKPLTFMNLSGESIGPLSRYYRIEPQSVAAVVDDVALPLGRLRLRASGSDGGHNGLRSLIAQLGPDFIRVRIGVGLPAKASVQAGAASGRDQLVDHVLSDFTGSEQEAISAAIEQAVLAIEAIAAEGITSAMNKFNRAE